MLNILTILTMGILLILNLEVFKEYINTGDINQLNLAIASSLMWLFFLVVHLKGEDYLTKKYKEKIKNEMKKESEIVQDFEGTVTVYQTKMHEAKESKQKRLIEKQFREDLIRYGAAKEKLNTLKIK